LEIGLF